MALIRICYSNDWFVDYDRDRGMYRVSYFQDNHFVDECWFDAYEEKELGADFPQTIGDITFYSKAHLFEWVKNQQKNATINTITELVTELESTIEDWKRLGYTYEEAEKLVEASKIYK